jgi:hypothetical protein
LTRLLALEPFETIFQPRVAALLFGASDLPIPVRHDLRFAYGQATGEGKSLSTVALEYAPRMPYDHGSGKDQPLPAIALEDDAF